LPPPPIDVDGGVGQASSSNSMSTLFDLPLPLFDGPSTSNGITNGSAPLHRLVIPDSSDDSSDEKSRKNNKTSNFVEIVDVVKPRHERTPEIIDLSSEVEAGSDDQTTKNKKAANNTKIEAIEISSDSEDLQVNNAESTASAHNSDNVQKKQATVQLEDEIAARAEFKRILESDRFTKRRILSYLQDFQPKKKPKPSFRDFKNRKAKDEEAADKTWQMEDNEAAVASGSSSTSHLPSSEIPSRKVSKFYENVTK
jgi:hypothetical protein